VTGPSPNDASRRRHPCLEPAPQDLFAHPSERAFARLLNLYNFAWRYEPVEFPLAWDEHGVPVRGFRRTSTYPISNFSSNSRCSNNDS